MVFKIPVANKMVMLEIICLMGTVIYTITFKQTGHFLPF
jgi:hypothetical protein